MSGTINLRGSIVAIITPFNKNGQIDETALRELVEWHIAEGTDGIVPCGTTGESATLSHGEHDKVVEIVIETVNRRIPVIAGAGSNSTTEAIRLTKHAASVEADFVLSITPYYNKPTQNGLIAHFTRIADESPIPLILYNVPGRTGVNMLPATVAACAKHPRIAGIKEATADLKQKSEIIENTPKDFIVLSGDDFTVVPTLAIGGKGVISVTANIAPRLNSEMIKAWESVDIEKAKALHYRLLPLARACFNESNPIPVKAGVSLLGKCNNKVRSPLTEASQATIDKMKSAIESLNSR